MRRRTCCGTRAPRTWWKMVRTCARCRRFWATRIFRPRRCIRTWRSIGCGLCIRNIIPGRRRGKSNIDDDQTQYNRREGRRGLPPPPAGAQLFAAHHQSVQRRSGKFCCLRGVAGMEIDRPHRDSRISVTALRKRLGQDFGGAFAGGGAVAVSLAGARRRG